MIISLTVKNKLSFVDGSLSKPSGDLRSSWIICNSIVTTWILNSTSKEISGNVNFSSDWKFNLILCNDIKGRIDLAFFNFVVSSWFRFKIKTLLRPILPRNELTSHRLICTCGRCSCGGWKIWLNIFKLSTPWPFLWFEWFLPSNLHSITPYWV